MWYSTTVLWEGLGSDFSRGGLIWEDIADDQHVVGPWRELVFAGGTWSPDGASAQTQIAHHPVDSAGSLALITLNSGIWSHPGSVASGAGDQLARGLRQAARLVCLLVCRCRRA